MIDKRNILRPAARRDQQDILAHAASHPAEHQKPASVSEDALQQAGLFARPNMVDLPLQRWRNPVR